MLNLTDEQKEKLRAGYRRAQAFPEGFEMATWIEESDEAPCGAVGCYAYEICVAVGGYSPMTLLDRFQTDNSFSMQGRAHELIGVPRYSLAGLFDVGFWPADLCTQYYAAQDQGERADLLAEAVERWIEGDGSFK